MLFCNSRVSKRSVISPAPPWMTRRKLVSDFEKARDEKKTKIKNKNKKVDSFLSRNPSVYTLYLAFGSQ